jgi:hypothetical protein
MKTIIPKTKEKINNDFLNEWNTQLTISFREDITNDLGNVLPYPTKYYMSNGIFIYSWCIVGFFDTLKSSNYINDIIARFLITYKDIIKDTNYFKIKSLNSSNFYKLKNFQGLKSITISKINETNKFDGTNDFIFWSLKLYSERVILETGIITYDRLFDYGYYHFNPSDGITTVCKDLSTLKAKCRSIVNYYIGRDYELDRYIRKTKTKEEWIMTRTQNMIKQNKKKSLSNRQKIENLLSGMFVEDLYKKPNGKYHISNIMKDLNLSRNTVKKHLKDIENEQN